MKNFKKYPNRKIYSLEQSQYVKLVDIYTDVKNGAEVAVKCHASNKDITNEVLKEAVMRFADLTNDQLRVIAKGGQNA